MITSMDCFFGGNIEENPIISLEYLWLSMVYLWLYPIIMVSLEYLWFSVDFLLNQSIDSRYRHLFNERNMEKSSVIDDE